MPRRRMIDPNIWKDPDFAKLTDAQKILFIGIISNCDDEGRIIATPESLKADIFPYDHKKTASVVKRLRDSIATPLINDGSVVQTASVFSRPPLKNGGDVEKIGAVFSRPPLKNLLLYQVDGVDYIYLARWKRYQAPKHFKPSILPAPPIEPYPDGETSGGASEGALGETSGETLSLSASPTTGRPSIGKVSIGKVSTPSEENFGEIPERPKISREADPRVKQVLDKISETVGYQIPNYAKEGTAIKRALAMKFTADQIIACWEKMKTFAFWKGKWLPLAKVTENLGEFIAGRLEDGKPRGDSRKTTPRRAQVRKREEFESPF